MVPAKVVCEALGINYTYNAARKAIYMTGKAITTNAPSTSNGTTVGSSLQATAFKNMSTQEFV